MALAVFNLNTFLSKDPLRSACPVMKILTVDIVLPSDLNSKEQHIKLSSWLAHCC